jgi:hypothetical protein
MPNELVEVQKPRGRMHPKTLPKGSVPLADNVIEHQTLLGHINYLNAGHFRGRQQLTTIS